MNPSCALAWACHLETLVRTRSALTLEEKPVLFVQCSSIGYYSEFLDHGTLDCNEVS